VENGTSGPIANGKANVVAKQARNKRVPIMFTDDELEIIDEWQHRQLISTRADAIRRLCMMAINLDEDFETVLDRSDDLLKSFEEEIEVIEKDMTEVKANLAGEGEGPDAEIFELLLHNLRVSYGNVANLFDEYVYVYSHWLHLNNAIQLIVQAKNRRAAIKARNEEFDRLEAMIEDQIERRHQYLHDDGPDPAVEKVMPLTRGRKPRRIRRSQTRTAPDVSS
jgi:hypothetical protein